MDAVRFDELNINDKILKAVKEMGFEAASPIQGAAIPVVLEGRDIVGQAQTGTGKTAAFGIPLLEKMDTKVKRPQAMILTTEVAPLAQSATIFSPLSGLGWVLSSFSGAMVATR